MAGDLGAELDDLKQAVSEVGGEDVRVAGLGIDQQLGVLELVAARDVEAGDAVGQEVDQRDRLGVPQPGQAVLAHRDSHVNCRAHVILVGTAPPHEVDEGGGHLAQNRPLIGVGSFEVSGDNALDLHLRAEGRGAVGARVGRVDREIRRHDPHPVLKNLDSNVDEEAAVRELTAFLEDDLAEQLIR